MCNRRDDLTLVRSHGINLNHKRIAPRIDEVVVHRVLQNGGSEWAEFLPELDFRVDDLAHVSPARVGNDTAVAKRASAPLHEPLVPADAAAAGDSLRGPAAQLAVVIDLGYHATLLFEIGLAIGKCCSRLPVAICRTPVSVFHLEPTRPIQLLVPD